jgi:GT2 family glycosyltransferase
MSETPPTVSIVIATYRRFDRLRRCIERTRAGFLENTPHEMIVVDGGSDDGTREWLAAQPDVRVHVESQRAGSCRAYNIGFRMARGECVMWLNDDAWPAPGAVAAAWRFLRRHESDGVGLVALYHNHRQPWNEIHGIDRDGDRFGVLHVRGTPYANFGLLRRELLERLGHLDERYYFCGWDPDLSLKVQREAGLLVVGCPDAIVHHEELADERKAADAGETRTRDNQRLFDKWSLPPKGSFPDPRPAYAELMRSLEQKARRRSADGQGSDSRPADSRVVGTE